MAFFLLATAAIAGLSFVYLIFSTIRQYLRLRHFNGPLWGKFTDLYLLWVSLTGRQHVILGEIVDKYGKAMVT